MSLPFAQCVRVLPELSQCSGKLSVGTHDSIQTGSYHKSPLCKKIACLLHAHTFTHTHTLHHAQGKPKNSHATGTVGLTIVQNIKHIEYSHVYRHNIRKQQKRRGAHPRHTDYIRRWEISWCDMYRLARKAVKP